ncbi:MAG TPA: PilZ domain-containing protein [Terriglobales bacterium]|nr:PilZ domain-containing protein [Terriglobales bacterium]
MRWFGKSRDRSHKPFHVTGPTHARAKRFTVRTPIRFRSNRESEWRVGITENISCTGVLFRSDDALQPRTQITMRFTVPSQISGGLPVEVICDALVVREATIAQNSHALAAAILNYHIQYDRTQVPTFSAVPELLSPDKPASANFVHQFNTHLAVIVGNCDLVLSQANLDPAIRKSVESVKSAGLKAASLVRELTTES